MFELLSEFRRYQFLLRFLVVVFLVNTRGYWITAWDLVWFHFVCKQEPLGVEKTVRSQLDSDSSAQSAAAIHCCDWLSGLPMDLSPDVSDVKSLSEPIISLFFIGRRVAAALQLGRDRGSVTLKFHQTLPVGVSITSSLPDPRMGFIQRISQTFLKTNVTLSTACKIKVPTRAAESKITESELKWLAPFPPSWIKSSITTQGESTAAGQRPHAACTHAVPQEEATISGLEASSAEGGLRAGTKNEREWWNQSSHQPKANFLTDIAGPWRECHPRSWCGIGMPHFDASEFSVQLPAPCVRVGLTFDWFYSMTSCSDIHIPLRLSGNRWGPRDWRGFRNLNFYKSYMPFSLKVNPFVCGHWRLVLGMRNGEGWRREWGVDMDLKKKLLLGAVIFIYRETL